MADIELNESPESTWGATPEYKEAWNKKYADKDALKEQSEPGYVPPQAGAAFGGAPAEVGLATEGTPGKK